MTTSNGAFADACEYVIHKDMDLKSKMIEEHLEDPTKHPWMANMNGNDMLEFIFGDFQTFVNKFEGLK